MKKKVFKLNVNGVQMASVNEALLDKYIELYDVLNTNPDWSKEDVVIDILYKDIIDIDFNPEDLNGALRFLEEIVELHGFSSAGEYIEYELHNKIEKKIDCCKNCEKRMEDGYCYHMDGKVSKNYKYCDKSLYESVEELPQEIKELLDSLGY